MDGLSPAAGRAFPPGVTRRLITIARNSCFSWDGGAIRSIEPADTRKRLSERTLSRMIGIASLVGFVSTIPLANWLIGNVGTTCVPDGPCIIPVGFGLMAPSGVLMVGLALVLRDVVQRSLGLGWSLAGVVCGAVLSWFVAPPALALASGAAFLFSELADTAVYTPLARRRLIPAVIASSIVGTAIDSTLFLWLAFGSVSLLPGMVLGKIWMVAAATFVLWLTRRRLEAASVR